MTTATATYQTKTNPIQEAALDTIYRVSQECGEKTAAGLAPFNINASFNARIARYMNDPSFILDNATWDEIVKRANEEIAPLQDRRYDETTIAHNEYGNSVNYVLINLVFSYGVARAVKRLCRANRHMTLYSTPLDIAQEMAFEVLDSRSIKSTGKETLQSAVIGRRLNAAQTKAWLNGDVKSHITNYIKQLNVVDKINPLLIEPLESEEVGEQAYDDPNLTVEDELQLEYLSEFMGRGLFDINEADSYGKVAMEAYLSNYGQTILHETNCNETTFYTQLLKLADLTYLTPEQSKMAHDEILNAYWQLLGLSQYRKMGERQRIKSKAQRSRLKRGLQAFRGVAETEMAKYTDTFYTSPYIDETDYDLMVRASASGFLTNIDFEFTLN